MESPVFYQNKHARRLTFSQNLIIMSNIYIRKNASFIQEKKYPSPSPYFYPMRKVSFYILTLEYKIYSELRVEFTKIKFKYS